MFANVYKIICARLREKMPELRQIALFNNQYENAEDQLPIFPPACFIEFTDVPWQNKGNKTQEAPQAEIAFHLVMNFMLTTNDPDQGGFEADQFDIQVLDMVEKLQRSIHGIQLVEDGKTFSTELTRIRTHQVPIGGGIHVWVNTYRCALIDEQTDRDRDLTPFVIPNLNVDKQ